MKIAINYTNQIGRNQLSNIQESSNKQGLKKK